MPYLQPTVRQLQPLGRRHQSAAVVPEEVDAHTRAAQTVAPDARQARLVVAAGGTDSPRARPCRPELRIELARSCRSRPRSSESSGASAR
jgi:hypothetical protein